MKALHFGAGNIGRGFIGQLLADTEGAEVVFADVEQPLIDQLNQNGAYHVHIVGEQQQLALVSNVRAVHSNSEAAIKCIATAHLITTAVGATILPKIAEIIARGLVCRYDSDPKKFLNIIACENMLRGTTQLKRHVFDLLPERYHTWIDEWVGFVDSVVDRIVPLPAPTSAPSLDVTVEEFSEWIIDGAQVKGVLPSVVGLETATDLTAFIERKMFTLNTGHAITAYLGQLAGHTTIRQAIYDQQIAATVRGAMHESGAVLIRRYSFQPPQHAVYIDKIITRFKNCWLQDEVIRVGRQPLRKLSASDRLIKPLLGAFAYQLPHNCLVKGVAAALSYHNEADQEAVELQHRIELHGIEPVLVDGCGLPSGHPLIAEITSAYANCVQQCADLKKQP